MADLFNLNNKFWVDFDGNTSAEGNITGKIAHLDGAVLLNQSNNTKEFSNDGNGEFYLQNYFTGAKLDITNQIASGFSLTEGKQFYGQEDNSSQIEWHYNTGSLGVSTQKHALRYYSKTPLSNYFFLFDTGQNYFYNVSQGKIQLASVSGKIISGDNIYVSGVSVTTGSVVRPSETGNFSLGAANIGAGSGVYSGVVNSISQLKTLIGGSGIQISGNESNDSLTLIVTGIQGGTSVDTGNFYTISNPSGYISTGNADIRYPRNNYDNIEFFKWYDAAIGYRAINFAADNESYIKVNYGAEDLAIIDWPTITISGWLINSPSIKVNGNDVSTGVSEGYNIYQARFFA